MKKLILTLGLVLMPIVVGDVSYAATGDDGCGTKGSVQSISQIGGMYFPSTGTLRALVVFVQFNGDNYNATDPGWPTSSLPTWASSFISPSVSSSYPSWSISDFYRDMSMYTFNLIGDYYPTLVVTQKTESQYVSAGQNYGDINKEILATIDPNILNWGSYDNWTTGSYYNVSHAQDGIVDCVFIIYRHVSAANYSALFGFSGISELGFSGSYQTHDGKWIQGGFPGSGCTLTKGLDYGWQGTMFRTCHEYGHKIFGSGHRGSLAGTTLMQWAPCYQPGGMNAYERYKAGYITLTTITQDQTVNLNDYLSAGSAIKVPISVNEYFIVENRRSSDIYDQSPVHGVYIYHVYGDGDYDMELATPNGFWDWALNTSGQVYKTTPDPVSGTSWLEYINAGGGIYTYPYTVNSIGRDVVNGNPEDAYNIGYAQVFSPWSNPNSNSYATYDPYGGNNQRSNITNVAIMLNSYSGSQANLSVHFNYWGGILTANATISGNATIAYPLIINPGVTLTIASGATLNFLSGSSLTVNGTLVSNATLTIPAGITMTVNAGRTSTFASGSSLVVNGTLNATGTAVSPITFTSTSGSWGGIQFQGGSGGALNYCNISHATRGVYLNHTSITTQNCTISGNSIGIQVDEVNVANFSIQNNTISNNSSHGIYINSCWYTGSSAGIANNIISYNGGDGICVEYSVYGNFPITGNTITHNGNAGIYCYYLSSPVIQGNVIGYNGNGSGIGVEADYYSPAKIGCNRIDEGNAGIMATYSSNVNADGYYYGSNSFYLDQLVMFQLWIDGSAVDVDDNYWGCSGCLPSPIAYITNGGSIYWTTMLPDPDPNGGMGNMVASNASSKTSLKKINTVSVMGDTSKFLDSDLRASLNSMLGGEFDDAIARYSKRYKTEQDPSKKRYVLIQLAECYAKANKSNFTDFLNSEVRPNFKKTDKLYATTLELENIFLTQSGKYDRAITNFNSLLSGFASDTAIVKHALYNLWSLYFLRLNDTLKAGQYFTELKTRFPKDNLTRHAVLLAKSAEVGSDLVPEGSQKSEQPEKTDTLAGNGSLGNYPNPFNPTTIINYQLSKSGHVTLKVYDILGREVATLVNENQNPGIHSTTFDASKLASGVYFYRLTAPGINQVKKMLLTK